jgi:hypothetical protein
MFSLAIRWRIHGLSYTFASLLFTGGITL